MNERVRKECYLAINVGVVAAVCTIATCLFNYGMLVIFTPISGNKFTFLRVSFVGVISIVPEIIN